jgi:pyrroline-5-carboxylate reductase
MDTRKIAFIGAGNMARSIIAGLTSSGYPSNNITATDPNQEQRRLLSDLYDINTTGDNAEAANNADVIILAVKPQIMELVCGGLTEIDLSNKLVISIAAGISANRLNQLLETDVNLVRVMPNTPALVSKGMSGLYATPEVNDADKSFSSQILKAVGETCWVEEESGINTITAASGSGPAYFFLFMEAMQNEAIAQGLDKDTARMLVQQTALGAAEMVIANGDSEISTLREQVTSKGGTTAAALQTFNEHELSTIVAKAMRAAQSRAEEMETLF